MVSMVGPTGTCTKLCYGVASTALQGPAEKSRLGLALHGSAETLSESKYSAFLRVQKAESAGSVGHT